MVGIELTHYSDIIKQVITEYATTRKLVNGPNTEFQLFFDSEYDPYQLYLHNSAKQM